METREQPPRDATGSERLDGQRQTRCRPSGEVAGAATFAIFPACFSQRCCTPTRINVFRFFCFHTAGVLSSYRK